MSQLAELDHWPPRVQSRVKNLHRIGLEKASRESVWPEVSLCSYIRTWSVPSPAAPAGRVRAELCKRGFSLSQQRVHEQKESHVKAEACRGWCFWGVLVRNPTPGCSRVDEAKDSSGSPWARDIGDMLDQVCGDGGEGHRTKTRRGFPWFL